MTGGGESKKQNEARRKKKDSPDGEQRSTLSSHDQKYKNRDEDDGRKYEVLIKGKGLGRRFSPAAVLPLRPLLSDELEHHV